jgi:hypothetical protein
MKEVYRVMKETPKSFRVTEHGSKYVQVVQVPKEECNILHLTSVV